MKVRFAAIIYLFILVIVSFSSIQCSSTSDEQADLVLLNGKVITVDVKDRIAEAVAVKGDKIQKVGTEQQIKSLIGPNTKSIDLKGKTLTPGIVDSHIHVVHYGHQFWDGFINIRFPNVRSLDDLLTIVANKAKTLRPGQWISGNQGFHFNEDVEFDKSVLDKVAPQNPVYLRHASGQYAVVNSMALKLAGINKNTPDPFGGKIVRDPSTGEPTGVLLHYPAENLIGEVAAGYADQSDDDLENDLKRGQDILLSAGITSGQDVIVSSPRYVKIYKNLADKNELKMRMYLLLYINSEEQAIEYAQQIKGYKSDMLTFGGWKLAIDGGIAAGTALMYDNTLYASKNSYYYYEPEVLNRMVSMLHDTGLQIAFHIIGDKGIDQALDAIEAAMKANPRKDPRHRIEHAVYVTPESLRRIKKLGVIISTQPQWISWQADGYKKATNETAMANFIPINSMLKLGIPVAFGCDVPAAITHEPKWAFIGATSRRTASGYVASSDQRIDVHKALKIHTIGSAYAAFEEKEKGSIEEGKLADLVVWSHDLYSVNPKEASEMEALITIVGGKIVYEKK